jgi:deoxyribodipyrimidine photo-lyase
MSAADEIPAERVRRLGTAPARRGAYVLYWMQQSQRAEHNHALEYAIRRADDAGVPVLVGFGLTDAYPEANLRHYRFMLEGLAETGARLARRGMRLAVVRGAPDQVALDLARRASLVVCDRGYLRHQRRWRRRVAAAAGVEVVQVESDLVVPVEVASAKAEYAARTFRPRVRAHLDRFLVPLASATPRRDSLDVAVAGATLELGDLDEVLAGLDVDRGVAPVPRLFRGGIREARRRLSRFLDERFARYRAHRNQPQTDDVTHLSPHLHFGQISPVEIALRVRDADAPVDDRAASSAPTSSTTPGATTATTASPSGPGPPWTGTEAIRARSPTAAAASTPRPPTTSTGTRPCGR